MFALLPLLAEGEPAPQGSSMSPMIMMLIMFAPIFIMMMFTSRRQRQQQQQMLANVKKNDKVITSSGIVGVVVGDKTDDDIKEGEVILRVDETTNTRIRILKSAIARVVPAGGAKAGS